MAQETKPTEHIAGGMDMAMKSFQVTSRRMQLLASEMAGMSLDHLNHFTALLDQLTGAKSLNTVLEVEARVLRASSESFAEHVGRVREIYGEIGQDLTSTYESAAEKASEAAKQSIQH